MDYKIQNVSDLEKLLVGLIRSFVMFPDDVQTHVEERTDAEGEVATIFVKLNDSDIGLCIGLGGKTAESLRRVIGLIGHRQLNKRVYTKIDAEKMPRNHSS